jgi:hypothetical protein
MSLGREEPGPGGGLVGAAHPARGCGGPPALLLRPRHQRASQRGGAAGQHSAQVAAHPGAGGDGGAGPLGGPLRRPG